MDIKILINEFANCLEQKTGVVFIGAGISQPSGLPSWSELLTPFAEKIGIKIDSKDDLPTIAQYIINDNENNRGPLVQYIKEKFIKNRSPNSYHQHLRKMKVNTIWTTNYDTLLEDTFHDFIKDTKIHDDAISRRIANPQIEIIKAHGCIAMSKCDEIILTLEDYDDFFINRPATAERLKIDMLENSFLFIGYGFGDSNIRNIIITARRLANQATRQHYMIQKKETDPHLKIRQKHWIRELRRIGIACALIGSYCELEQALEKIATKSRGKTVFVTGGHKFPIPDGASKFGKALSEIKGLILMDGQSEGISRSIITSFSEACLQKKHDIGQRIHIFPNPYAINPKFENDKTLLPELKKYRRNLLRETQVIIVFPGEMGTQAEVDVAREMGCCIIPVPLKDNDFPSKLIKDEQIQKMLKNKNASQHIEDAKKYKVTPESLKRTLETIFST